MRAPREVQPRRFRRRARITTFTLGSALAGLSAVAWAQADRASSATIAGNAPNR